jgi:hypothetical protein
MNCVWIESGRTCFKEFIYFLFGGERIGLDQDIYPVLIAHKIASDEGNLIGVGFPLRKLQIMHLHHWRTVSNVRQYSYE